MGQDRGLDRRPSDELIGVALEADQSLKAKFGDVKVSAIRPARTLAEGPGWSPVRRTPPREAGQPQGLRR